MLAARRAFASISRGPPQNAALGNAQDTPKPIIETRGRGEREHTFQMSCRRASESKRLAAGIIAEFALCGHAGGVLKRVSPQNG